MEIANLDTLIRPRKTISLAGKEINISKVPLIVNIKAPELYKKITGLADMDIEKINSDEADKMINDLLDLVMVVINANPNEGLTREWFLINADSMDLFEFLTKCVNKDIDIIKKKKPAPAQAESTG